MTRTHATRCSRAMWLSFRPKHLKLLVANHQIRCRPAWKKLSKLAQFRYNWTRASQNLSCFQESHQAHGCFSFSQRQCKRLQSLKSSRFYLGATDPVVHVQYYHKSSAIRCLFTAEFSLQSLREGAIASFLIAVSLYLRTYCIIDQEPKQINNLFRVVMPLEKSPVGGNLSQEKKTKTSQRMHFKDTSQLEGDEVLPMWSDIRGKIPRGMKTKTSHKHPTCITKLYDHNYNLGVKKRTFCINLLLI